MRTSPPHFEIVLNVIGYQEDDEWVALALEMDIRGYGRTFDEALADLKDLVCMQISFTLFKNQPEAIRRPAEPIWFQRFAEMRAERMNMLGKESPDSEYQIAGLPLPPPHVLAKLHPRYTLADGD